MSEKFYEDILLVIPPQLIRKQNKSRLHLELITGGELKFFSGEALQRSRGWEFDLLIVDEAAYIPDLKTEWDSSLRPLLMKTQGKAIFISTPFGKNYFFSLFEKGQREDNDFKSWQFSSYENPYIPKSEFDDMIKDMPSAVYNQEILAQPGENSSNPFGTDNIERNVISTLSNKRPVVYGIDLAERYDWTVIIGLDEDGVMCHFDRFQRPWNQIPEILQKLNPDVLKVVDSTGVGSVIMSFAHLNVYNIRGFDFTKTSKPALMNELISAISSDKLKYNRVTGDEMHTLMWKPQPSGHIKFEAQSGYKDDCVMALALANHYFESQINDSGYETFFI